MLVTWRDGRVDNFLGMAAPPIVVLIDERPTFVVQFHDRIGQHSGYAERGQSRANRADYDSRRGGPTDDEAPDHDVVPSPRLAASGNIAQAGIAGEQIVELEQCVPLGAVYTSDNGSLTAGG